jgi:hypothetical protein
MKPQTRTGRLQVTDLWPERPFSGAFNPKMHSYNLIAQRRLSAPEPSNIVDKNV